MNVRHSHATIVSAILLVLGCSTAIAAPPAKTMTVDCASGQTIADALNKGNTDQPLLVLIRGTCNESVRIERSDVTLSGETGSDGTINGPDSSIDTVTVVANRVTIERLRVSGGRNGVTALGLGLTLRDTTIQATGRNGISFANGAAGLVDHCVIRSNARDGIGVETSQATIINSDVSDNVRDGILVNSAGAARIGVDPRNDGAGNTIQRNGRNGINIVFSAAAIVAMNNVANNALSGISVSNASADVWGGNEIKDNTGQGISARTAALQIGNPPAGFPTTLNTVSGNGSASAPGGISTFLGAAISIRDAVISENKGAGVLLNLRSTAQLTATTISDNRAIAGGFCPGGNTCGDGIRLSLGSGLLTTLPPAPAAPTPSTISGNDGAGIKCNDQESSVAIAPGSLVNTQTNDCSFF
jgi:hypothetical protein